MNLPSISKLGCRLTALSLAAFLLLSGSASAEPLLLMIQPTLGEDTTRQQYQPLADYLTRATGSEVTIVTKPNFFAHWDTVRRNRGYDLVLDDAHFTDYRVLKFSFVVLAKLPGTASYSLIVLQDNRVADPLELAGKTIASFGPPSIGAARLSAMFNNPSRRPTIVDVTTPNEGLELLRKGKVVAAMLPTSAVSEAVGHGRMRVIMTTEPTPQMALSVAPRVAAATRDKIRAALLEPAKAGAAAFPARLERFEPATAAMYANQARILRQYWGY
jgi:ABC-type phosphate/phosphonate transport system substrate-binding protein